MKAGITARVVLAILFVGMLATPLAIKQVSARREEAQAKLDEGQAIARYGFHLQEVSQQAGVHFVHQAPSTSTATAGLISTRPTVQPAARTTSTATCTMALSRMLPRNWAWPM
jgi:hypothetical protein